MPIKTVLGTSALLACCWLAAGCNESVRLSRGLRSPEELRGASSAAVTERFTRQANGGDDVSVLATLIDYAYVKAVAREWGRTREQEREAFDRYLKRQTTFYVYLVLRDRESCQAPESAEQADAGPAEGEGDEEDRLLDLRSWNFVMRFPNGRQRQAAEVEPEPTQMAPTGGCLVQGYVHFPNVVPPQAKAVILRVDGGEGSHLKAELRWDLQAWAPAASPTGAR
jgi:hypothetical protein